MKQYSYKAKKSPTETVEGRLTASTREEAVAKISDLGLVPVDLREVLASSQSPAAAPKKTAVEPSASASLKIKPRERIMLYRQWGRMLRAGIPILRTLGMMLEQDLRPAVKKLIQQIHEDVKQGHTVSAAAAKFPHVFLEFDVALIRAGESVGKLYETLLELAEYREKQLQLSSKLRNALAYPLFVAAVGAGTVTYMLSVVIPQFSHFFNDLGQELPLATRLLMSMSGVFQAYSLPFLIGLAAAILLLRFSLKVEKNRIAFHRFLLTLPAAGPLQSKAQIARISRTLELLLSNGLSLLKALQAAQAVCTNEVYRIQLATCQRLVEEGGSLSDGLRQSKLYPPMVIHLVKTGEESGNLHESMKEIADWYEGDVQEALQTVTKLIEPVFILAIGLVLGAIVMALLLPVFSMSAAIS